MSGLFYLDLPSLSLSLFNASLLLWLGLTVALNAERRAHPAWGTWLITGSLLLGALFFISHSALLSLDLNTVSRGLNFWWQVGWWPVLALPLAWYLVVLWYSGFWDGADTALRRRQQPWLWACALALLAMVGLVVFANPLPVLGRFAPPSPARTLAVGGLPLLILAYPAYSLLCTGLALDALLRPGPSRRAMGDLARRRARPWLTGASLLLLLASVLASGAMLWFIRLLNGGRTLPVLPAADLHVLAWLDLVIQALIAIAAVLVGQALVAYEVFTGKSLPRRALLRHWRSALALAAGFGLVAGFSLAIHLRPIYSVLLSLLLLSVFYALFSWRAYAERERAMQQLRPFVTSPRLYDHLLAGDAPAEPPAEAWAAATLAALCRDVLGGPRACLAALGPSAPLVSSPLCYPPGAPAPADLEALVASVAARASTPQTWLLPIEPAAGTFHWAVPLWSERGLAGALLLGARPDGGLFAQEEIEIARAGGERLIDSLASAELARRLLALQRQRLAESQVLDRRARRVLHDDVLPQLHAALLHLDGQDPQAAMRLLGAAHHQVSDLLRDLPASPAPPVARLGLLPALRQLAETEFAHAFDLVTWDVEPAAEQSAVSLAPLAAEVLFYAAREAMRNAARHGRVPGSAAPLNVCLGLRCEAGGLTVQIEDTGPGPQAATDPASPGTGQGLALHSALLAVIGGTLSVAGPPTRVSLTLPASAVRGLLRH
jgi:signal transduction histidine kinase